MRLRFALALSLAGIFVSATALAVKPKDAQALKAIKEAVETDYLETHFDDAEQKLRGAIAKCGVDQCTPAIKAKVFSALGSVLASGKKQLADAKEAFTEAMRLDRNVKPNADIASTEADYAFELAKKEMKGGKGKTAAAPVDVPKEVGTQEGQKCKHDEDCAGNLACQDGVCAQVPDVPSKKKPIVAATDDSSSDDKPKDDDDKDKDKDADKDKDKSNERKNWISLLFSPDLSVFGGTNVCTPSGQGEAHYYCLRGNRTHYVGFPTVNNADNVSFGVAPGTMRVMLGYERIVASNVGLGVRLGFAFNGASDGGASFLPVHAEARLGYYLGKKPFVGGGVRPSIFLAVGAAEVDGQIAVNVLEDGTHCGATDPGKISGPGSQCTKQSPDGVIEPRQQQLTVYKQSGPGFAGGGLGLALAPVESVEFQVGARIAVYFPAVLTAISPEAGFAIGF